MTRREKMFFAKFNHTRIHYKSPLHSRPVMYFYITIQLSPHIAHAENDMIINRPQIK